MISGLLETYDGALLCILFSDYYIIYLIYAKSFFQKWQNIETLFWATVGNTHICLVNDINLIDGEVCISSYELIMDDFGCSGDPFVIPVGIVEVLQFVLWV